MILTLQELNEQSTYVLKIVYVLIKEEEGRGWGRMCHFLEPKQELSQNMSSEIWYGS